jgi:hypothetical protein
MHGIPTLRCSGYLLEPSMCAEMRKMQMYASYALLLNER